MNDVKEVEGNGNGTSEHKKRQRSSLTIELTFNRAKDKNEDEYFIGHDPGIDFPVNLGDFLILFFPGKDKLPPKMVLKPRKDFE